MDQDGIQGSLISQWTGKANLLATLAVRTIKSNDIFCWREIAPYLKRDRNQRSGFAPLCFCSYQNHPPALIHVPWHCPRTLLYLLHYLLRYLHPETCSILSSAFTCQKKPVLLTLSKPTRIPSSSNIFPVIAASLCWQQPWKALS